MLDFFEPTPITVHREMLQPQTDRFGNEEFVVTDFIVRGYLSFPSTNGVTDSEGTHNSLSATIFVEEGEPEILDNDTFTVQGDEWEMVGSPRKDVGTIIASFLPSYTVVNVTRTKGVHDGSSNRP